MLHLLVRIFLIFFLFALTFLFQKCGDSSDVNVLQRQYNVSILIDLSDRIKPEISQYQIQRDKELIKAILNVVKSSILQKGAFNSEDRINILFYPQPDESNIAGMADVLNFDLSKLEPREKKILIRDIDSVYDENLSLLYEMALNRNTFDGSDIWRFFKDEVKEKCIVDKSNYDNFLIILTDGYIYWKNTMLNDGNKFSYILPTANHVIKFRSNINWKKEFKEGNYGLIPATTGLNNLKILMLELNPAKQHPDDYDILSAYLSDWLKYMGVSEGNYKILKTDLPVYIKPIIESFLTKE